MQSHIPLLPINVKKEDFDEIKGSNLSNEELLGVSILPISLTIYN